MPIEMNMFITAIANKIFREVIHTYHIIDDVTQPLINKYPKAENLLAHLLYHKCWIDTMQWHYEDMIRDPDIAPADALVLKRKIDRSNQKRTDIVEVIDTLFLKKYAPAKVKKSATINTESPAWAIDRLSILALKIYHMHREAIRKGASSAHRTACQKKLAILLAQRNDLSAAIDTLLKDIENGRKYMKVYKQMKMYNEESLNPILRSKK